METSPVRKVKFSLEDQWSRQLFIAVYRRYSMHTYRYARQRHTTVMVKGSQNFIDHVLWPEFQALSKELFTYFNNAIEKIIKKEVHNDTAEAQEINQLIDE